MPKSKAVASSLGPTFHPTFSAACVEAALPLDLLFLHSFTQRRDAAATFRSDTSFSPHSHAATTSTTNTPERMKAPPRRFRGRSSSAAGITTGIIGSLVSMLIVIQRHAANDSHGTACRRRNSPGDRTKTGL